MRIERRLVVVSLFLYWFSCVVVAYAQETPPLGLQDWIAIARENATGVKVVQASYQTSYWDFRFGTV